MNYKELTDHIRKAVALHPEPTSVLQDWIEVAKEMKSEGLKPECYEQTADIRNAVHHFLQHERRPAQQGALIEVLRETYFLEAEDNFDSYCIALEWQRPPEKKFYEPRRDVLHVVACDLQDLYDRVIVFLGVSLPVRVGKSTLCIFFITWVMGKHPRGSSLMCGYSDDLVKEFYKEAMAIINGEDDTYLWKQIFPNAPFVEHSALAHTIHLAERKRFATLTCRAIHGSMTGAVETSSDGVAYVDDLIKEMDEALNPDRLERTYQAYQNMFLDRLKMGCMQLMVGTRWNVFDPLGRIEEQYGDDPRYRFRVIPALDENDESNFNYRYGLGFDTAHYLDMRAKLDSAAWMAKFQGNPFLREGLLFPEASLKYYNGNLPSGEPDRVVAACDVAWGGGDSLSMPIAYVYGQDVYVHDWVFNAGFKDVTKPLVVSKIKQHTPGKTEFEANNGGDEYADDISRMLREQGYRVNVTSRKAPGNQAKLARICDAATDILNFYFIQKSEQSQEYRKAMRELCLFSQSGKNKHDDAADSIAMLAKMLVSPSYGSVSVGRRKRW